MTTVRTVAVIGAGDQGREFAAAAAHAGYSVVLEDVMPARLRHAQQFLADLPSLRYATTVEDAVREADLAIDFVPDELESKLEIISLLDRMAPPRTIFLVPTRTLSITDLASCTYRPAQCVGVRPGLPDAAARAALTNSVELIRSRFLSPDSLAAAQAFFAALAIPTTIADDREEPMLVKNLPRS